MFKIYFTIKISPSLNPKQLSW